MTIKLTAVKITERQAAGPAPPHSLLQQSVLAQSAVKNTTKYYELFVQKFLGLFSSLMGYYFVGYQANPFSSGVDHLPATVQEIQNKMKLELVLAGLRIGNISPIAGTIITPWNEAQISTALAFSCLVARTHAAVSVGLPPIPVSNLWIAPFKQPPPTSYADSLKYETTGTPLPPPTH